MQKKYFPVLLCVAVVIVCLAGCATKPCADPETCLCGFWRGGYHDEQGDYHVITHTDWELPEGGIWKQNKYGESVPLVYDHDYDEWRPVY